MRIIAIGDIHGRSIWKEITAKNDFDKVIFIGDYFDSFDIPAREQMDNFLDMIAFKKANMDKVILLFGNHDYHYLRGVEERYSGYQNIHSVDIGEMLHGAIDNNLIKMCHIEDKFLFTHAGVTKTWCKNWHIDKDSIEDNLNDLLKHKPDSFKFQGNNIYGDNITQSPIWVRPRSLHQDAIKGYVQVVGHTQQDELIITDHTILIDCLDTSGEYLEIIDGKPMIAPALLNEP